MLLNNVHMMDGQPVYMPECSCGCCTMQKCDGVATHKCLPGDKLACMTQWPSKTNGKCKSWVDDNLLALFCNPAAVWGRFRADDALPKPYEGVPPDTMDHNVFCKAFCTPEANSSGSACPEVHPPIKPATCCPCDGSDLKVPVAAEPKTTLVNGTARTDTSLIQEVAARIRRKPSAAGQKSKFLGFQDKVKLNTSDANGFTDHSHHSRCSPSCCIV